jgi:uncharacterized membrane-anchored protein YhcB (DUF1043 family)
MFATKMFTPENRRRQELEKQLQSANASLKDYQQEVSEHYVKTAKLVEDLTDSYRNVHNHLAEGAATLLSTRGAAPLMKTIPSREQIEAISELPGKGKVLPPLDYAPKQSPDEKGMLDESFGLDTEQAKGSPKDPMQEFYTAKTDAGQAEKTS